MIPPFKWLYTFMNTPEEWHTTVIGLGQGFCPWQPRYEPDAKTKKMIRSEYWYYMAGTGCGFALLILVLALAVSLVITVIT